LHHQVAKILGLGVYLLLLFLYERGKPPGHGNLKFEKILSNIFVKKD